MAIFWGVSLALGVALFAAVVGFDRERSFYPVVMVVIAIIYDLFAVAAGSAPATFELLGTFAFIALAVAGFRWNLWITAAALALHGAFDLVHADLIPNPGVPAFWPEFCSAYDFVAAACLGWLILSGRQSARPRPVAA